MLTLYMSFNVLLQISNFNTFDGQLHRMDQQGGTAARVFPMPQQVKNSQDILTSADDKRNI